MKLLKGLFDMDVIYSIIIDMQLRAIVDGVPPDFQKRLHIFDDQDPQVTDSVEQAKEELQRQGATHVRLNRVFQEGRAVRYFMDGWMERPIREADLNVKYATHA